ncbi:MAG: hypothetical protein AAF577_03075 [Pseudomonadota bacterium]
MRVTQVLRPFAIAVAISSLLAAPATAATFAIAPFTLTCTGGGCQSLLTAVERPDGILIQPFSDITVSGSIEADLDGPRPEIRSIDLDLDFTDYLLVSRGFTVGDDGISIYEGELARYSTRLSGTALQIGANIALTATDGALALDLSGAVGRGDDNDDVAILTVPIAPSGDEITWRTGVVGPGPVAGELILRFLPGSVMVEIEGRAAPGVTDFEDMWAGMTGMTRLSHTDRVTLTAANASLVAPANLALTAVPPPPGLALIVASLAMMGLVGAHSRD